MLANLSGRDSGGGCSGKLQPQLLLQHPVVSLRLRVARQQQFAPIGGGDVYIHHVDGLELGRRLSRRDAAGQRPQLALERDLQAKATKMWASMR